VRAPYAAEAHGDGRTGGCSERYAGVERYRRGVRQTVARVEGGGPAEF
jgi:hypothetical protein